MTHNSELIFIRDNRVRVDAKVKDLVLWLNTFDGVETEYSCQGLSKEEQTSVNLTIKQYEKGRIVPHPNHVKDASFYPYVSFKCSSEESLKIIIDCIQRFQGHYSSELTDTSEETFVCFDISYDNQNKQLKYQLNMGNDKLPNSIVNFHTHSN